MMGMHDLGKTYPKGETVSPKMPEKMYPMLHSLTADQLPGIEDYDVGETVTLVVQGVIKSKSSHEREGKKDESIDIELHRGACQHTGAHKVAAETGMSMKQAKHAASQERY